MELVDAGHHLEELAGEMGRRVADAARRHVELARMGLGVQAMNSEQTSPAATA